MLTIERLLLTYVVNAIWTTCVVAGAAALLSRWIRQSPSSHRHTLWVMALAVASFLPLTTLRNRTSRDLAGPLEHGGEITARSFIGRAKLSSLYSLWLVMREPSIPAGPFSAGFVSALYAAFLCYRGTRLWWAWRRTKQIVGTAAPAATPPGVFAAAQSCRIAFGLERVTILTSRAVAGPVALGDRHPVLIFPEWFFSLATEDEFACSLCHELAHVRRKDFLLNLVYEVVSLPLSFHPAMAFIKARVDRSREQVCDEIAASRVSVGAYVQSLVRIAQSIASVGNRSNLALGLFDTNSLEERVFNLLGETKQRCTKPVHVAVASGVLAATCLLTAPFSFQVAAAPSPAATLTDFRGKWEAGFEGRTFLTIDLRTENDNLTATISRTAFHLNPAGELIYARQQSERDAVSEARLMDGVLVLATGKNGLLKGAGKTEGVPIPIRYKMRIVENDQAELRIDGVPSGMPVPKPWKLKREPATR